MLEAAAVEIVDPRDCDLVDEFSLDAWPAGLCPSRESEPSFSGQIAAAPAPSQLMPLIPCAATSMLPGGCSTSDTRNAALPCGPRQLGSGGGIEGGGPAAFGFASSFVLSRSPQRFLTGSSMRTGTAASGEGGCSAAVVHPPPPPMQMCMDGIKPAGPSPRAAISAGRQADWQPAALEVLSSNNPEDRRIQQPRPVDTDAAVSSASVEQLTMPSHAATLDTALRLCETRDVKDADTLDASSVRAAAPHSSAHRSRGAVAPEEALAVAPSASHEPPTSRPATPVHPVAASPDPLQARALLRQQYCYTTTPSHSPATAPPARGMTQQTPSPITPLLQNQNSAVGSHGSLLPRPSNGTPWTSRPPRPTSRPQERSSEALMPPSAQHGSHWWNGSKPTTNSHQSSPLVAPTARTADATTTSSPDHQETQAAGPCGIFGGTAGPALPTNSHDGGTEAPNAVDIIQQYEVPADCSERAVGTNSAAAPPTPQGCCIASNATALTSRMAPAAPGGAAPAAGIHGLSVCSSTRDVLLVDAGGATAAAAADRTSPHVVSARGVVSPRCLAAAAAAATDRQVSARGVAPPHCPSSAADTSARSGPAAAAGGVRVIGSAANYLGSAAAHLSAGSGTAAAGVRPGARLSWVAQLVGDQADRPSPPVQDYSPSGSHRPLHNSLNQSVNHSPSGSYRPLHHSSIPGGLGGPHAGGEEDLMDVLRYTRPVVKRGGSSLGGQQPHGFQPVHSPLLHHPGQGASGTGASSSSSMRHFRDRPPTKLFSPYGGVRPGQSPVGQQQLTLPPSVTVPLEVEFREAFFNQHLCEAWHEGQRWARMDVCGMEVADTPKAAHHLRLQVARQKLSMNRGQGAVEVLTRRVTAEWQHLRAVREAAALRSVPVTATASTRTAGRGGGTPPCCGTSPSHSHQATTVLACTRGAVGAAAGGGSDTPPPCCGMPHPHSHHITTAAGGGAAAGGGTPPSCCDALQPHSHHTIIAPAGTAAAISIAGGGGGTPPSCCDTLQPHSHQTTVTPVSTTAVIRAAAGGGTPPCMTPCAGEQSVMENMGCDGGRQCQAAIANLDCDTVEQHQAAAFANMACDSAEGHQAAAGSSAGVVLSCVNEAHTDLADAACLVELRTTAGTAQGGSDDKPATKDDTLSHDAGVTLESNVHVDECATDAAARESGSGCSSSGVAAHRRSPADWYRAARMLKGWAMGALAGGISGATAAAAAGDRQDNDKVMPTSTVDGAFAGTPSPSSTAGPTPPAVSATPFPSAAVAAAVTRMGGWTGTPSAGVPATAQGVAETATPSAGPFGTTPPVSAGGLLLPPRPWRELSVLGSPSILKAGRHCRLGLVASPVPKCVVFATELELGPMAGYHP